MAAERIEHEEIKRQQLELQQSSLYNYEETNIDDVDDAAMERRLAHERALAQSLGLKSHSFYSSDEDPNDIEAEFQRRLQEENERQARERRLGYEPDDIEFQRLRLEREQRAEQELKLQLMINDHRTRRAATRSTSNDVVDEQQKRMQKLSVSGQIQTKPTEDDWFALQRQKRLEQKQEQERIRKEQRESDERERQRKVSEVKAQREQEQKMMAEYQRQKELDQKRGDERFQQEDEQRGARDRYNQGGNQIANHKEIVKDEFKEKALADYERRRATLDKEVERAEREKRIRSMAPPVAKKPAKAVSQDDDDELPPPRPPPPSAVSPASIVRSSTSSSPSPQSAGSGRFSFSQKTVSNINSQGHTRSGTASPPSRIYSQTSQFQARSASNSRSPSREDPATLDFKQKMKMFGLPQKAATGSDMRSTFSKKQREYMD